MHKLKKGLAAGLATLSLLAASPVLAQGFGKQMLGNVGYSSGYAQNTDVSGDSLPNLIGGIVKILLSVLGGVFLVLMVYAGYLWMTARGDSKIVEKAKDTIKQSIIGIIIVLAAYVITGFVVTAIEGATKPEAGAEGPIDPYADNP